jgi:hypothetical protein
MSFYAMTSRAASSRACRNRETNSINRERMDGLALAPVHGRQANDAMYDQLSMNCIFVPLIGKDDRSGLTAQLRPRPAWAREHDAQEGEAHRFEICGVCGKP